MIAVIDYGVGNLFSVEKALLQFADDVVVTGDEKLILAADKLVLQAALHLLNEEERQIVLLRTAAGLKHREIAADLDITLNTVKYHIKNILQKTGYQNTLQLVAEVVEKRLILPKY